MKLNLFPKDKHFYEMFSQMMENAVKAAEGLLDLLTNFTDVVEKAKRIKQIEHDCDGLTHEITRTVNQSFVTPIDREDIYALASAMDDVVDLTEAVSDAIVLYSVRETNAALIALAEILLKMTRELKKAIDKLQSFKDLAPYWIEVHTLENQADDIYRKAISLLFADHVHDTLDILKWKEIYDIMEGATDKAEDVAKVIQNIYIKHS